MWLFGQDWCHLAKQTCSTWSRCLFVWSGIQHHRRRVPGACETFPAHLHFSLDTTSKPTNKRWRFLLSPFIYCDDPQLEAIPVSTLYPRGITYVLSFGIAPWPHLVMLTLFQGNRRCIIGVQDQNLLPSSSSIYFPAINTTPFRQAFYKVLTHFKAVLLLGAYLEWQENLTLDPSGKLRKVRRSGWHDSVWFKINTRTSMG